MYFDSISTIGKYSRSEVRICVNTFVCLNYEEAANEVLETMAHELVHYWNAYNGIKDCDNRFDASGARVQFHNGMFRKAAMEHGPRCGLGASGFGETSLTDESWELIKEKYPHTWDFLDECHQNLL